jgi:hypothetical protein
MEQHQLLRLARSDESDETEYQLCASIAQRVSSKAYSRKNKRETGGRGAPPLYRAQLY